jgi:HEAT repeat protein
MPGTDGDGARPEETNRRRSVAAAGHHGDEQLARGALGDPAAVVRATALGALARMGRLRTDDVAAGLVDAHPAVRRRACDVSVAFGVELLGGVVAALGDVDGLVVEAACVALGEGTGGERVTSALALTATGHPDALCREAAVGALGALGDAAGLAAILQATTDKPAVRRRAVLALAPFEGPEVDTALERARHDRDWQVRQAAEDLLAG